MSASGAIPARWLALALCQNRPLTLQHFSFSQSLIMLPFHNLSGEEIVPTRTATCRCGQLQAECEGEPVRISVCHCLECQKRSGSAFATQARWPDVKVTLTGDFKQWKRTADSGHVATYQFCPICGSTLAYVIEGWPGVVAIPVGAFADPNFPQPLFSVYEHRKHTWAEICGKDVEHSSEPSSIRNPGQQAPLK